MTPDLLAAVLATRDRPARETFKGARELRREAKLALGLDPDQRTRNDPLVFGA